MRERGRSRTAPGVVVIIAAFFLVVPPLPGACRASQRQAALEEYLAKRFVPDPTSCLHRDAADNPIDLIAVEYSELDSQPGEEAVVRGLTCNTGTAVDISLVLRLTCSAETERWKFLELPVDQPSRESWPGHQRYTPRLRVDGKRLQESVLLYEPGASSQDPSWEWVGVYLWNDSRFALESDEIRELNSGKR